MRARSCAGSGRAQRVGRRVERAARLGGAARGDAADDVARERRPHLGPLAGLDALAADQQQWSVTVVAMPTHMPKCARVDPP